ncbi:hypothetical protein SAMN05878482_11258 [Peribacillus simplex]|uniref:Uncharacterized protein n=1 Tax=Peribacillus simplex TaxID=1478 RepID=A0A9X8REC9_9BACI|nr:hypothetical protein SAMN05878482_11258 [Peribacillus simplex]
MIIVRFNKQLIEMLSEALESKKEGFFLPVLLLGILINDL